MPHRESTSLKRFCAPLTLRRADHALREVTPIMSGVAVGA